MLVSEQRERLSTKVRITSQSLIATRSQKGLVTQVTSTHTPSIGTITSDRSTANQREKLSQKPGNPLLQISQGVFRLDFHNASPAPMVVFTVLPVFLDPE